jgi:hypothetical protein
MKTKVLLVQDQPQCRFKKGDVGYIDGYVQGGTGAPLVAVVIGEWVDVVYFNNLKVIVENKQNEL